MNIEISTRDDGAIVVKTMDGDFIFQLAEKSEFDVDDTLDIKTLIRNIWSNAKIKDSSLIIEIKTKA